MKKRYRFLIILAVIALGFYFIWPSVRWYFIIPQAEKDIAESSRTQIRVYAQERADAAVNALVALQEKDAGAALPDEYSFIIARAKPRLASMGTPVPSTWTVKALLDSYATRAAIAADFEDSYRTYMQGLKDLRNQTMQLGLDLKGGMYVTVRVDYASYEQANRVTLTPAERDDKMKITLEVLRNKIDQFGLTDPSIRTQGSDQIIIEIPGTSDPETVNRFIKGKGSLTFQIVDEDGLAKVKEYAAANPGLLLDAAGNVRDQGVLAVVPKGSVIRGVFAKDSYGLDELKGYTVLFDTIGVNGTEITSATVGYDNITGEPTVHFNLTAAGGEAMYKLSGDNVGKRLAVALDDKVKTQATIRERLRDAVQVSGGFSQEEASDLALTLRTGALPVPVEIISSQQIGASLGQDAIGQGLRASGLGLALVFLFMLGYYRRAGLNAVIANLLNLYLIVAVLSVFGFTLTLAAIAGLVLNVGMAVDASVLIFERMKEEMRLGKTVGAVVKSGFERAFLAIADSNITTIIAALVLTQLAKGAIQGFAVTLAVGNVATLFSAVFVSRLIFDFNVDVLRMKRIRVSWRKIA